MSSVRRVLLLGVALSALLVIMQRDRDPSPDSSPRFDRPDAAEAYAEARRAPGGGGLAVPALYERASEHLKSMPRYASRIGRTLPFSAGTLLSSVGRNFSSGESAWFSGTRTVSLSSDASPLGILDAMLPGPRGGRRLASTATGDFLWVNDLEQGIGDTRRLYAATRTGVHRSLDGGETWARILTTTVRGGCLDLAMRPDSREDGLFASCGSYEQAAVYRFAQASGGGQPEVVLREPGMGRTSLAIAPSNPEVVYALAASNDPGPQGLYRQALLAVSVRIAAAWRAHGSRVSPTPTR